VTVGAAGFLVLDPIRHAAVQAVTVGSPR
jgi:hypothetical protein